MARSPRKAIVFLGLDILKSLVDEVALVENLADRELNNPEGAGFDLRIRKLYSLRDASGYLGVSDRETPEAFPIAESVIDGRSEVALEPRTFYLMETVEVVNMPIGFVGVIQPRSTLFRSGVMMFQSQINPGYSGTLTFGLHNAAESPFRLQLEARVAHLMVVEVRGATSPYRGQWQGGRVWTEMEEQT